MATSSNFSGARSVADDCPARLFMILLRESIARAVFFERGVELSSRLLNREQTRDFQELIARAAGESGSNRFVRSLNGVKACVAEAGTRTVEKFLPASRN